MGTFTLDEMKTEIREGLGGRADYDTRLTLLINLAQMRLARRHDFEELRARGSLTAPVTATPVDDMTIALPTSPKLRKINSIAVMDGQNSQKLLGRTWRQWDSEIPKPEEFARGRPSMYRRIGDSIEIWRIPDIQYTLRTYFTNWPIELVDGTDKSDLDEKDDLIILLSLIWLSALQDRPDRANYFWAIFKTSYEEAMGEDLHRPDENAGARSGLTAGDYWLNPFEQTSP